MNVPDPDTLASFRRGGRCELCGQPCMMLCGAHIWSKGAGRVDLPFNLVAVGMNPLVDCDCHVQSHCGILIPRERFLVVAAARERTTPRAITAVVHMLRRLPKNPRQAEIGYELNELEGESRRLAEKAIARCKELGLVRSEA